MAPAKRSPLPLLVALAGLALLTLAWLLLESGDSSDGGGGPGVAEAPVSRGGSTTAVAPVRGSGVEPSREAQTPVQIQVVPPRLGPERITLAVRDAQTGRPVPQFQLNVVPFAEGDPLTRLGLAERQPIRRRDGIFGVDKDPGHYDVVVLAPGYQPEVLRDVEVPALDARPLTVLLDRGPGIAGTVYDSDGLRRGGVAVFLGVTRLYDEDAEPPTLRRVSTGLDGGFSFSPLPAGEYSLSLLEPDNPVDRVAGVRVATGTTRLELLLSARHRLTVQVESHEGRPLSDVRVELRSGGHFASGVTNRAGIALLDDLPDGDYELIARHPLYEEQSEAVELIGGMGTHLQHLRLVQPKSS